MYSLVKKIVRGLAMRYGLFPSLYRRLCRPMGEEYAEYLRRHGKLHAIGKYCSILPTTIFTDPAYVKIGNNVRLGSCTLIGHDGSVIMLNRAYNVKLDRVGKIDIRDNVYVGYQAVILPDVTIGPNAIIGAGAVVTKDVPEGSIVAGVPAKPVGRVEDLVKKLEKKTQTLPWADLIYQRQVSFDPEMEPQLERLRVSYFYGSTWETEMNSHIEGRSPENGNSSRVENKQKLGNEQLSPLLLKQDEKP